MTMKIDIENICGYKERARELWGDTPEFKECEERMKGRIATMQQNAAEGLMDLFVEFGTMRDLDPSSEAVQAQVVNLQDNISDNFYKCSNDILGGLGKMYAAGGEFTENIDAAGGKGTAEFVDKAIEIYCG